MANSLWEQLFGEYDPMQQLPPIYPTKTPIYSQLGGPPTLPPELLPPGYGYGGKYGAPSMSPDLLPAQEPLVGAPGMPSFTNTMSSNPAIVNPRAAPAAAPAEPPLFQPRGGSFADRVSRRGVVRDEQGNVLLWPTLRDSVLPEISSPIEPGKSLAGTPMGGPITPNGGAAAADLPASAIDPAAGQVPGRLPMYPAEPKAPPLPPPIDLKSMPQPAPQEVASPFDLAPGQTGTLASSQLPATSRPAQGGGLPDPVTAARQIIATTAPRDLYTPQSPSGFERASAVAHNLFANQGLIPGIFDAIQGGMTGQRVDPQGMALAAQNNMYRALLARGYTADMAMAGATNPEILKQLMAPPTWGVISEGIGGQKRYGFINPQMGTVSSPGGGGAAGGHPIQGNYTDAQWDAMTSEQRLATVPKADQEFIKGIYEGRTSPSPRVTAAFPAVTAIYPDFDQQDYFKRHETIKSFAGQGKNALEKKALNTAITHADNLYKMIDELPNTSWLPGYVNPFIHALKANTGDEKFQQLRGRWDAQAEGLANELSKMLNGGQTSQADRDHARAILAMAKSPAELKAAVAQLMDMAQGRADSLQALYDQGMKQPTRDGLNMVDEPNRQIFMRLRGLHGGPVVTAGGQTTQQQAPGLIQGHIPPPPPGFRILQ